MIALAVALALATASHDVTVVFGGDVALGRVVRGRVVPIGGADPFGTSADLLRGADLAVVNLECTLSDEAAPLGGIRLIAPTARARVLADAGVDLVSVANNHATDAGVSGVVATLAALDAVGVAAVGTRVRRLERDVRGTRFAFMAVTDRVNATTSRAERAEVAWVSTKYLYDRFVDDVRRWRDEVAADVYVVLVHWGAELAPSPSRAQRRLGRALVDAGATLVVGHGAHVVQEVERHRGGIIIYSLGNLVFDMDEPATQRAAVARVRLVAGRVVASELVWR